MTADLQSRPARRWNRILALLGLLWYAFIVADFTIVEVSTWLTVAAAVLYVATCLCLRAQQSARQEPPAIAKWLALPVLACIALIVAGNAIMAVRLDTVLHGVPTVNIALIFANGALGAAITGASVAYPVAVLAGRRDWVLGLLIFLWIFYLEFPGPFNAGARPLTIAIMAFSDLCLLVAVVGFPWVIRRRYVRSGSGA